MPCATRSSSQRAIKSDWNSTSSAVPTCRPWSSGSTGLRPTWWRGRKRSHQQTRWRMRALAAVAIFGLVVAGVAAEPAQAQDAEAFLTGKAKDCPGCDLANAQLKRRNLAGANLAGANLAGASFHRAVLRGANLAGANLTDANLNKADLLQANLSRAKLNGAMLFEARSEERRVGKEGRVRGARRA